MRYLKLFLLLFFPALLLRADYGNDWIKKETFAGGKRERAIAFSIGGRGYIGCGQDTAEQIRKDLWEYDSGTNSWTQKADLPGSFRRNAFAFGIGNSGYVGGGVNHAVSWMGIILADFWEYNAVTNSWIQRANCPIYGGAGVYYSTGFSINGRGYVCCGKVGQSTYTNQLWEYNPVTNGWVQRAPFPGGVRYAISSFVIGNFGYVGMGAGEDFFLNDFYRYSPSTNSWQQIASFPGSPRFSCSAFSLIGKGFVVLGGDGGYRDELFEYDPNSDFWMIRAPFQGGARRNAAAFVIGNKAYVGTGKGATGKRRDFWEYTPLVLGVNDMASGSFSVFPNPVTESFSFSLGPDWENRKCLVEIFDHSGKLILSRENYLPGEKISRGEISSGVYFFKLSLSSVSLSGKLIFL